MERTKHENTGRNLNIEVLMANKIRIDNAIGMFTADATGDALSVKRSGNGAVIPFLKRFIGKRVVVFVIDT